MFDAIGDELIDQHLGGRAVLGNLWLVQHKLRPKVKNDPLSRICSSLEKASSFIGIESQNRFNQTRYCSKLRE